MNVFLWIKYYTNSQKSTFKTVVTYVEIIFPFFFLKKITFSNARKISQAQTYLSFHTSSTGHMIHISKELVI